jgi:hypothetical protein
MYGYRHFERPNGFPHGVEARIVDPDEFLALAFTQEKAEGF